MARSPRPVRDSTNKQDLTGQRFGGLIAKSIYDTPGRYGVYWLCTCDCGNDVVIRVGRLTKGKNPKCKFCSLFKHGACYSHEYAMFQDAKSRAKRDGVPFNLDLVDIVIPGICPALGLELQKRMIRTPSNTTGVRTKYVLNEHSPSLDRIDPQLGYVKGNVWVISARANRIKNNSTPDELIKIAEAVRRKQAE